MYELKFSFLAGYFFMHFLMFVHHVTLVNLGCQNIVCNIICIFSLLLIVFVQA